tara:strand:+ start:3621 stop:3980 length:360 start_codon:yes stop_codon:yes gene_type:complete
MFFSSDEEYDDDPNYDPYAERIYYCKYGSRINPVSKWCCVRCFEDSKIHKPSWDYLLGVVDERDIDDDWKVMKLKPPKSKEEIRKQFRRLALQYHPDKNGSSDLFIKLKNSYDNIISAY